MPHRRQASYRCVLRLLFPIIVIVTVISLRNLYPYLQPSTHSKKNENASSVRKSSHVNMLRSGSPPRVDRSILEKLRSLDGDEYQAGASTSPPSWPPEVTRLPVENPTRFSISNSFRDTELDAELCKTTPCRLLLPTFIGEQESKARRHLLQISHLSQSLNRTLVLPNVGRSRMGSCAKWDFGFYYELAEFRHAQVGFREFRRWVALRASRPRAQVIEILPTRQDTADSRGLVILNSFDDPNLENAEVAISTSRDPAKMPRNHCLHGRANNLLFGDFSPMSIYPRVSGFAPVRHSLSKRDDLLYFGLGVKAALSSPVVAMESRRFNGTELGEPDVLLLSWDFRHTVFPLMSNNVLKYATKWTRVAESLSTRLQPFIAVHWRMERVPTSSLLSCAPLLISAITSLLTESIEITSVYFATDYPSEGLDKPHSSTFHVGEVHHTAIQLFETAFAEAVELNGVRLTNLIGELGVGGREGFGTEDLDAGLMGIIDKMVSTRATLFISGGPRCGKPRWVIRMSHYIINLNKGLGQFIHRTDHP
ncbi:hypothetical protein JB92DRAFT_2128600 [Gautieria morchelliformis]|nr:hypothetical protein JB92DRAFT_2128600 [Gautieria morchelliformis]